MGLRWLGQIEALLQEGEDELGRHQSVVELSERGQLEETELLKGLGSGVLNTDSELLNHLSRLQIEETLLDLVKMLGDALSEVISHPDSALFVSSDALVRHCLWPHEQRVSAFTATKLLSFITRGCSMGVNTSVLSRSDGLIRKVKRLCVTWRHMSIDQTALPLNLFLMVLNPVHVFIHHRVGLLGERCWAAMLRASAKRSLRR